MVSQPELASLKKGDLINHFFLVKKVEQRNTKQGKPYLTIELADKTASITSNIWDNFEYISSGFKSGDIVKVSGVMDEYQGNPQLRIGLISAACPDDNVSHNDFMQRSKRNLEEMLDEFRKRLNRITDSKLKQLMKQIFNEDTLRKFSTAPAGKYWHHSYLSGLIEHSLELIKICDLMCDIHPEIHRDILICGAMMHDFGKIEELTYEKTFDYSDKGKLIGHIVISAIKINEECNKISNFPEDLKNCLMHIVLSHQGKLEFASPVVPKTLEAITLYQADELSAKVNAYKNALSADVKGENKWTKFITLASTDLFNHGLNKEENFNKSLFGD